MVIYTLFFSNAEVRQTLLQWRRELDGPLFFPLSIVGSFEKEQNNWQKHAGEVVATLKDAAQAKKGGSTDVKEIEKSISTFLPFSIFPINGRSMSDSYSMFALW